MDLFVTVLNKFLHFFRVTKPYHPECSCVQEGILEWAGRQIWTLLGKNNQTEGTKTFYCLARYIYFLRKSSNFSRVQKTAAAETKFLKTSLAAKQDSVQCRRGGKACREWWGQLWASALCPTGLCKREQQSAMCWPGIAEALHLFALLQTFSEIWDSTSVCICRSSESLNWFDG